MQNFTDIENEVEKGLRTFRMFEKLSESLKEIQKAKQTESAIKKINKELDELTAKARQVEQESKQKAEKAESEVSLLIKDAKDQALKIISDAKIEASDITETAKLTLVKLESRQAEVDKSLAETLLRRDEAAKELAEIQSKIEDFKKKAKALLEE